MAERLDESDLLLRLSECPESGSLWRHYRGDVVRVAGRAILESSLGPLVLYRHAGTRVDSRVVFARPLAEWREAIQHEGEKVERFTPVGEG